MHYGWCTATAWVVERHCLVGCRQLCDIKGECCFGMQLSTSCGGQLVRPTTGTSSRVWAHASADGSSRCGACLGSRQAKASLAQTSHIWECVKLAFTMVNHRCWAAHTHHLGMDCTWVYTALHVAGYGTCWAAGQHTWDKAAAYMSQLGVLACKCRLGTGGWSACTPLMLQGTPFWVANK
jgi:hypothetical protein